MYYIKMKNIVYWVYTMVLIVWWGIYAQTVDIGENLELVYGTIYTAQANINCISGTVDSKTERSQDSIRQHEWTWYTFTATSPFQLNALLTCYPSGLTWSDSVSITIKNPTISAWNDSSISSDTIVWLTGIVSDTPCTSFNYQWEQISGPDVEINNSWQLMVNSPIYDSASFIFPDTTESIAMRLLVTPQSCYHAGNTYSGIVTYTKLSSGGWGWWGWGWSSVNHQNIASQLFADTWTIENIILNMYVQKNTYAPLLHIYRNTIWWDGYIEYIVEYSTWSDFTYITKFATTSRELSLPESILDPNAHVHYFRLKAWYMGKYSHYSKVVKYYPEDYLPIHCINCCTSWVKYDDVLLDIDVLLEWIFNVRCTSCNKSI